ncbi:hypothetical protein BJ917_4459 [Pseudomonas sp. WPR_5_2]|uniref:Uncharacterized protein n=1 Tax=Pseudomonas izuensis TaxID=2684212 RepID=A0ABM7RZM5_9PSED|nr:hypothetical protein BJ917_4459 [Pseudomonas sp. WPR_5_2]BCX70233.1 hypothetical protein LAB08_R49000 [Pseudomonas izuensis]
MWIHILMRTIVFLTIIFSIGLLFTIAILYLL